VRLLAAVVGTALLWLPAVGQPAVAQQTAQEVVVNFLSQGEPDNLDPSRATFATPGTTAVIHQVFEPLLRFDEKLTPQPAAAAAFDVSPDGTVVTFHLRPDGRWSDGQPVTAQQFEFAWKRILDPSLNAEYASFFVAAGIVGADDYNSGRVPTAAKVGVRALDDLTLEVRLNQPFGPLADLAALPVVAPLRPDIVAANPDDWTQDPSTYIGNGPFAMAEWTHGDHITLVPNARYTAHATWPRPTLARVTVAETRNPEAAFAAFTNNPNRGWTLVPDGDVNQVLNDPALAAHSRQYSDLTTFWVQVNNATPPLNDVNVRRALARAIDRAAFVRDTASGVGVPMASIIPPGMPGFQDGLGQELGFDPLAARNLLAQAGFANGPDLPSLTFSFPATIDSQRRAANLQAQWRQTLGIDVGLNPVDPEGYEQALADKNYDLAFGGWAADYPDPQNWFNPLFGCQGSSNAYNYCNSGFDQLVARADTAADLTDRVRLYNQAQSRLIGDVPVLPLFARGHVVLVKPWVQAADGEPLPISPLDDYPGSLFLDRVQILPH
jgi:oligopeptide transport system substrate-binding protein